MKKYSTPQITIVYIEDDYDALLASGTEVDNTGGFEEWNSSGDPFFGQ